MLRPSRRRRRQVPPMPNPGRINPVALLRRLPDTPERYEIVARWFLGEGNNLPRANDRFIVRLTERVATGPVVLETEVAPQLFAMLDPPRLPEPQPYPLIPGSTEKDPTWNVAQLPVHGVDCSVRVDEETPDGFGVCHLLQEAAPERAEWRIAHALHSAFDKVVSDRGSHLSELIEISGSPDQLSEMFSRFTAATIVRRGTSGRQMRRSLANLVVAAADDPDTLFGSFIRALGFRGRPREIHRLQFAIVLSAVLRQKPLVQRIDEINEKRESVREQLRLRALTGGHMLDFWCSPDQSLGACSPGTRGEAYPGSELIGLGVTLGPFNRSEVDGWRALGGLLLQVHQNPIPPVVDAVPLTAPGDAAPGDLDFFRTIRRFGSGSRLISPEEIDLAVGPNGSSFPPAAPTRAWINYDMVQTNPGVAKKDRSFAAATGDGAVEIIIEPPLSDTTSIAGFNAYCMWRTAATRHYFEAPFPDPTPAEIRPWLVSRRYSSLLDLKKPFPLPEYAARLDELRRQPPWQPILLRADKTDVLDPPTELASKTVNDPFYPGKTLYRFDLRQGMADTTVGWPASPEWDPKAPISSSWSPEHDRDGDNNPAGDPQLYRFWVSAVDGFEQESNLIPVDATDLAVGDTAGALTFNPVRRDPVLPPSLVVKSSRNAGPERRGIDYKPRRKRLTINWRSSLRNQLARRVTQSGAVEESRMIEARLILFRRALRTKVDPGSAMLRIGFRNLRQSVRDLPQWSKRIEALLGDRWEIKDEYTSPAPSNGDDWELGIPIEAEDLGYEYRALVGFVIKTRHRLFWAKDAGTDGHPKRTRWLCAENSAVPEAEDLVETPTASEVAETDSIAIANPEAPRPILPKPYQFIGALPIKQPPGLSRDETLFRLMWAPDSEAASSWSDTQAILTSGQIATIQTALIRCGVFGDDESSIASLPTLEAARWILAAAFRQTTQTQPNRQVLSQHATVGFRGAFRVDWSYLPRHLGTEKSRAEAVLYRVYSARCALSAAPTATQSASLFGHGTVVDVSGRSVAFTLDPRLDDDDDSAFLRLFACSALPALIRLDVDGGPVLFGSATTVENFDCDANRPTAPLRVTMDLEPGASAPSIGDVISIAIFGAQIAWEREVSIGNSQEEQTQYLPVGGGPAEAVAYWLGTVSAEGRESRPDRLFICQRFLRSIEPNAPTSLRLDLPTRAEHFLDPAVPAEKAWLPRALQNLPNTRDFPRLVLSWEVSGGDDGAVVEIHRQIERTISNLYMNEEFKDWEAIARLSRLAEGTEVPSTDLEILRRGWLRGHEVRFPTDVDGSYDVFVGPLKKLPVASGVKQVRYGQDNTLFPSFIDYNADNEFNAAMDGASRYRYRLVACLNIGSDFLRSPPTPWTEAVQPRAPGFTVASINQRDQKDRKLIRPCVKFLVQTGASPTALASSTEIPWRYRVQILRLVPTALRANNTASTTPAWIEVGESFLLSPGGATRVVPDPELERDSPTSSLNLRYRIVVQQVAFSETENGLVERIVRSQNKDDEFAVRGLAVTVPPGDPNDEWEMLAERPILIQTTL